MDDTNPEKETDEFVNSIIKSVRWLGFDYGDHLYYASDYFDTFECAKAFIRNNLPMSTRKIVSKLERIEEHSLTWLSLKV